MLRDRKRLDLGSGIFKGRHKTCTFQMGWPGQAAQFGQGRVQVEQLHRRGRRCATLGQAGRGDDQGNGGVPLVVGGFAPQTVLTQMKAVVGGKHDDGVVLHIKPVKLVKDAADLRVHVGRGGIVAPTQFANVPRRWFAPAEGAQQLTTVVQGDVRTVCRLGQ